MTEKVSIGSAIDSILSTLDAFEPRDQEEILGFIQVRLKIVPSTPAENALVLPRAEQGTISSGAVDRTLHHSIEHNIDIKTLKEQKSPRSARQMACIVAFYLQEYAPDNEKRESISVKDAEFHFKQASYKLPSKLEQLLIDCKSAGYFQSVGRGEYKLTRVGYNLVAHSLPTRGSGND